MPAVYGLGSATTDLISHDVFATVQSTAIWLQLRALVLSFRPLMIVPPVGPTLWSFRLVASYGTIGSPGSIDLFGLG